jgi:TRAP-type C4-dicarboxylate transport system permease small subunit
VATVAVLIVPVTMQVIARFTPLLPAYIWTEELARFLFIWMVMLGAMIGVREGTHFEVDVWPDLKPRATALLRIVSHLFVLVFALVFIWWGTDSRARLGSALGNRRAADVDDLHRVADLRRNLRLVSR